MFKIRTETAPVKNAVNVSTIPQEFLDGMTAEYSRVKADPTQQIVISGENAAESTLYLQYAKAWGTQQTPALFVTKLPPRKGDNVLDVRLGIVDKASATPRGRRTA